MLTPQVWVMDKKNPMIRKKAPVAQFGRAEE
jgi:hypothetical protein